MPHKERYIADNAVPRLKERADGFSYREWNPKTMPKGKSRETDSNVVYVVKYEKRSGSDIGHPIILAPSLAVSTAYRTKEKARFAMREIAHIQAAYEVARAGHMPSPASLNVIPYYDENVDSLQVLTMEGMMYRYFIEKMPLV